MRSLGVAAIGWVASGFFVLASLSNAVAQTIFQSTPIPTLEGGQEGPENLIEDQPVRTRIQPDYQPNGIRAGSWLFQPSLLTGAIYDSNVFAQQFQQRSDVAAVLVPTLTISSLSEQNAFTVQAQTRSLFYSRFSELNQTEADLRMGGRIDIRNDLAIAGSFRSALLYEAVGSVASPAAAVEPTPYTLLAGEVSVRKDFGRLTTRIGQAIDSFVFGSTVARDGRIIRQSSRNGQVYTTYGRLDYAFSPMLGAFAAGEWNTRNLRDNTLSSSDSSGYRLLSGVTVELTRLVRAEVGLGYFDQNFDNPLTRDSSGLAYRASIIWSPTRLVDITFKAESNVGQTVQTATSDIQQDIFSIVLDYELRRNILLSLKAAYERDDYLDSPRKDDVYSFAIESRYKANRNFTLGVGYQYFWRDSDVPTQSFTKHQVGMNVTAQF